MIVIRRAAAAAIALLFLQVPHVEAGSFHQRTLAAGGHPESRERVYQVYIPDGLPTDGSAPLVTVLHGCRQSERNMIDETGFVALADAHGFALAFPFITSHPLFPPRTQNCWGFWLPPHRTQDSGEPADLRRIIAAVEEEFATDPAARFVTGLSSGGAMAVVLAVAYSEDIAAAAAVAGLPYGEQASAVTNACGEAPRPVGVAAAVAAMAAEQSRPDERRLVPLLVMQSVNDCRVQIVNGENLRDAWRQHHGALPDPAAEADCTAEGVACTRTRFADAEGRPVVETAFYAGRAGTDTHYWPGDGTGPFANPDGPSASALIWSFFAEVAGAAPPAAEVTVTGVEVATRIAATVRGHARAEGGVAEVTVRLAELEPPEERPAAREGEDGWSVVFEGLEPDRSYTPVVTATLPDGRKVTRTGAPFAVGNPPRILEQVATWQEHMTAGRLAMPGPDCPSRLFGACDRDLPALIAAHGFEPFPLFAREGTGDWFADRDAVPGR